MISSSTHLSSVSSPVSQSRLSLAFTAFVLCLLLVPYTDAAARRQRCRKVGFRRVIDEPGCEAVAVDVFRCEGHCLSFSFPSSDKELDLNSEHTLTVRAKCCRIIEIEMISVDISCSDAQRSVEIPSARECGCHDCEALI